MTNRDLSLSSIEGPWKSEGPIKSRLERRCRDLYEVPVKKLEPRDLRVLINQKIGTETLIPIALRLLDANPWLEGDLYPGDLLCAILRVEREFWLKNPTLHSELGSIMSLVKSIKRTLDDEVVPAWVRIERL
jgi:hypothetical protein